MPGLFLLVIVVGIVAVLWRLLAVKELALIAAKKHCRNLDAQFLDGSVAQCGLRFKRISTGRVVLVQKFQFEFSITGERRYLGWTEFVGRRMLSMELQPHVVPEEGF